MRATFKVGCDVVETNTFGGSRIVLAEFDLQDRVAEINIEAANSREKSRTVILHGRKPRFVAGSIGPTTKLPSLGHITFDNMVARLHGAGRRADRRRRRSSCWSRPLKIFFRQRSQSSPCSMR